MLADADETYRQLGLDHWVASAVGPRADKAVFPGEDGELWLVAYQSRQARVRGSKGMAVLHGCLSNPIPSSPSSIWAHRQARRAAP